MDSKSIYKDITLDVIIADIVRKAAMLLVCALVGLFVVTGLSFIKTSRNYHDAEKAYLEQTKEYEKKIAFYQSSIDCLEDLQSELSIRNFEDSTVNDTVELIELKTTLEAELDNLKAPEKPASGFSKRRMALGFLCGGFLALIVIVIRFMSSNPVVLSYDAERRLDVPLIGALFQSNSVFDIIARKIIGERVFKDCQVAEEQIKNNIACSPSIPEKGTKIAIICSTKNKKIERAAETVCSIVTNCGYSPVFVSEVPQNPDAIKAIMNSEVVFLLEEQWKSKWIQVGSCTDLVGRCCKRIAGLILC